MARKESLRALRTDTVINKKSRVQEKALDRAVLAVQNLLGAKFPGITLKHERSWKLKAVVSELREQYPEIDFHYFFESSSMRPDGGILSVVGNSGKSHPILIAEKKNQGTNDLRATEGKLKQSKGNAIERLGKNVIGFRTAMKGESIFPFVCFGDGCDFDESSSILDRVVTIAQFGRLNHEHLHKQGGANEFDRGTFYFRVNEWTEDEMTKHSYSVAEKCVFYYFSKYGESEFVPSA